MKFQSIALAAAALPAALAFPFFHEKRGYVATDATLYAYGVNVSGLPVLYSVSDSLLYIAPTNTSATGLVSVTWDIPTMSSASSTESTATLINGTSPGVLAIGVSDTSLTSVEVIKTSTTTNATTTGFTLYGKQMVYYDGSSLQAKFWARPVNSGSDSIWELVWNYENADHTNLTPVSLKTIAPASTS